MTLKYRLGDTRGYYESYHSIDCIRIPYSSSFVTMAVSFTVFKINRDIIKYEVVSLKMVR